MFKDLAVGNAIARQGLDETTEPHHVDDLGKSDKLLEFGARNDDSAFALARHSPQKRMDLSLVRTSMPWVGSSMRSTRAFNSSARASATFCWLPPLSVPILASVCAGLTENIST